MPVYTSAQDGSLSISNLLVLPGGQLCREPAYQVDPDRTESGLYWSRLTQAKSITYHDVLLYCSQLLVTPNGRMAVRLPYMNMYLL